MNASTKQVHSILLTNTIDYLSNVFMWPLQIVKSVVMTDIS